MLGGNRKAELSTAHDALTMWTRLTDGQIDGQMGGQKNRLIDRHMAGYFCNLLLLKALPPPFCCKRMKNVFFCTILKQIFHSIYQFSKCMEIKKTYMY